MKPFFEASKPQYIFLFIIAAISIALYLNTITNDFVYDDKIQILSNPWIRDTANIPQIFLSGIWGYTNKASNYYRPMMHIIYMIGYHISGLKPWGFHLINIILHAGVSALIFLILSLLLDRSNIYYSASKILNPPFIAAVLFAAHPIHTEVVAWAGSIPDLSFSFFYLLSFYLYIKPHTLKNRTAGIIFFFIAALSKETALTLPLLLITYDYSVYNSNVKSKEWLNSNFKISRYLPYLIIIMIYLSMRIYAIGGSIHSSAYNNGYGYIINILPLFASYVTKLILPLNLNVFHPFHPISSIFEWRGIISFTLIGIFFFSIYHARKKRLIFMGFMLMCIPLLPAFYVPALGANPFAERYLYLPSAGFTILFSILICKIYNLKRSLWVYRAVVLMLSLIIVFYSIGTIKRNAVWKDDYSLWLDSVKEPHISAIPYINAGIAARNKGMLDDAIFYYETALRLEPNSANAYINLGTVYIIKGMTDKAVEHYLNALRISPNSPEIYNNLGAAYQKMGAKDKALMHYQKALNIKPDFIPAMENLKKIMKQ